MPHPRLAATITCLALGLSAAPAALGGGSADRPSAAQPEKADVRAKPAATKARQLDRSGRKRVGKASFYARKFAGRRMADGNRMDPRGDNAASKTLPLGTRARVTNLENGKSAVVSIQDRGPHVPGRIVDLSPATAEKIGLTREQGLARVEVTPIDVPEPGERSQSVARAE